VRVRRDGEHDRDVEFPGDRRSGEGAHVRHPQVDRVDRARGAEHPADAALGRDPAGPGVGGGDGLAEEGNRREGVAGQGRRHLGQAVERGGEAAAVEAQEPAAAEESVAETAEGNIVVSFRNISTVIMIERATGDIVWQLAPSRRAYSRR